MAGDLSLELPGLTVRVEDTVTEKVGEGSIESVAFFVVVEVGLEDVLDHNGVACEDLACSVGAAEDVGGRG